MGNFFSSLFSSNAGNPEEEKAKKDEKNFDILKYDGIRAQKIGQLPYAMKCFEEALNIQNDFETKGHLVGVYTALGRLEDALDIASEMVEEEPTHTDTRFMKISLLLMLDKAQEVVDECNIIVESEPENNNAWYKMARAKRDLKDDIGALAGVSKAIAINQESPESFKLRAEILMGMNQLSDALEDVEKAINLLPEDENYYILRGEIHQKQQCYDKAQEDFSKAIELNPFCDRAYIAEGALLIAQNKPDEAILYFNGVIEENPQMSEAYAERGRAKRLKGDSEGAMEDLKKSIELNPEGEAAKKLEGQHTNFGDMYKGGIF